MATAFIQSSIFSNSYVLTSEANSIVATTDAAKLTVSLTCSGDTFFTVDLYAYDGKVELFDPGSIIEDYFIAHQMICESITVQFGTASKSVLFLYCENVMPESFDPAGILLLSSQARRVHKDSSFTVASLPVGPTTPFVIKAVGHDSSGDIASVQFQISRNIIDTTFTTFTVREIIRKATGHVLGTEAPIPDPVRDVMYFSVEHGGRQLMCYITPAPAYLTFRFRNIYNVPELVDVEGSMVTKSETSRQTAKCSGDIVQYDRRTDRTYQVTTGALPADEVESLAQLVSSHSVQLLADGSYHDIVIEEHTCEDSTEDDSLSVVKFTWRFKGRRPVKFNSALLGIQPTRRDIFSDEYSPEYE